MHERFNEGVLETGHGEDIKALLTEKGNERSRLTYTTVSSCYHFSGGIRQ